MSLRTIKSTTKKIRTYHSDGRKTNTLAGGWPCFTTFEDRIEKKENPNSDL
jgi:hypothetical protein